MEFGSRATGASTAGDEREAAVAAA